MNKVYNSLPLQNELFQVYVRRGDWEGLNHMSVTPLNKFTQSPAPQMNEA